MLTELVVEGLGVIDRAELHLTNGSSALTGETGAGKTLLVAALGLLLGARADKTLVREGSPEARVDARFELGAEHPVFALLLEQDLVERETTELVLTRTVGSDGRSKARVNGRPVTLNLLQGVGRSLVEIAGQNEHHHFGAPSAQRELLDGFAGEEARQLSTRVAGLVKDVERLRAELEAVRASERDRARELDALTAEIKEIDEAAPRPDETTELTELAARLEHADAISSATRSAIDKLKGEGGVGELLAATLSDLSSILENDPSAALASDRLQQVSVEVADIAEELSRDQIQADPAALATARDRLATLSRLLRKYGKSEEEVLAFLERARSRVAELEGSGFEEERLTVAISDAEKEALDLAEDLSARRKEAAPALELRIESALGELSLGDARFKVDLEPCALSPGGLESVGFLIAANMGESPKPISKVASGGELSRIALALRSVTSSGDASTLVFDEVDAGVGGEAARSVGAYLAAVGERASTQVLVVTHLPQVAAFADHQYRVSKVASGDRTASLVEEVEGERRVEELSRMLAGLPESERAREHAQELLEIAGRQGRK